MTGTLLSTLVLPPFVSVLKTYLGMAWITAMYQNLQIVNANLTLGTITNFNTVALEARVTNLFAVAPSPATATISNGYVIIIPRILVNGSSIIVPREIAYYPRGYPIQVPIYNPYRQQDAAQAEISLYPVQRFDGAISPQSLDFQLLLENDAFPGLGYPV